MSDNCGENVVFAFITSFLIIIYSVLIYVIWDTAFEYYSPFNVVFATWFLIFGLFSVMFWMYEGDA